jgi:hypothetical protein
MKLSLRSMSLSPTGVLPHFRSLDRKTATLGVAFIAAAVLATAAPSARALSEGQDAYGNQFVSGGVSNGELRDLQARKDEHRLSLVTVSERGAHLAGVLVRIVDSSGNVALETEMDGPWLLADLPPGRYTLEAVFDGETRRQQLTVPAAGARRVDLYFDTGDRVSPDLEPNRPRAG